MVVMFSLESIRWHLHLPRRKKQCSIYQVRPQQCKAFPWWAENLRSKRSWKQVKATCPGLTAEDAILISGDEIRLHVHADRQSTQGFQCGKIPDSV